MDQLAIGIMTGVEVRAVAKGFVSVLIDDCAEVLFVAIGVPLCLLALIASAVVTVLQILFRFEL